MQHPSKPSWFVVTILLLALAACSQQPGICSVEGVVRFPDGQPLTEGTVAFEAVDHQPRITATGEIGPGGTFRLGTYGVDDGAVPGRHRVAVIVNQSIGTRKERPDEMKPSVLAERYRDFETSGLEFTIKLGENTVVVEVQHPEK